MAKKYDIPLRKLFKELPPALFRLAFGTSIDPQKAKLLDVKLPKLFEREADLVVEFQNEIYHLEIQSTDDPNMHLRMAYYFLLIYENYKKIPKQAVVYVGEAPLRRMKDYVSLGNLKFSYKLIDLNALDCTPFLESPEPSDWIIAILCRIPKEKEVLKEILLRFSRLPKEKRDRYLEMLFHLAHLRPKRLNLLVELKKEVRMPITINIEQSPFYKEGLEKGIEKAKREDAIRLYKKLKLQPEQIAEVLGVEKEKVLKWLKEEGLIE
ncbi:Rpn family recombination-promoting nuclease/putative transposase [Aquifex pyrophilus]